MAAQQQSLLNVQNNLANVIKNIESNLFTRIQRLENNVIDKIDNSSSNKKPETSTRVPIEVRAEELRQRHADKMPTAPGQVLVFTEWELNREYTTDEKNATYAAGDAYNTTLAGKATISFFDHDTLLPYETVEIVNYADYAKLLIPNYGDFALAGYQYTVENPADGVASTVDLNTVYSSFKNIRLYIFVYPGERDLVMEFWDSTESMPAWDELKPSTQTLYQSLEEIWPTLSFNSYLLNPEIPGLADERFVATADV